MMLNFIRRADETCPTNDSEASQTIPIIQGTTFHQVILWTSVACTIVTVLACGYMYIGQLLNYRHPPVQKQYLRIILMPIWLGCWCLIGVAAYGTTHYVEALAGLYEVFIITVIYHLMLTYLAPAKDFRTQIAFFSNPTYGGYKFFRLRYILVMQALPGRILTTLATFILTARSCQTGRHFERALMIISIVNAVQLIIAVAGVLPTLKKLVKHLKLVQPDIMGKLLSVKLVVIVQILISLVLRILISQEVLTPTRTISYNDLTLGLNAFVTVALAFLTSLVMLPYFRPKEFKDKALSDIDSVRPQMAHQLNYDESQNLMVSNMKIDKKPKIRLSPFRALFDAANIIDILFVAQWRACKLLFRPRGPGGLSTQPKLAT